MDDIMSGHFDEIDAAVDTAASPTNDPDGDDPSMPRPPQMTESERIAKEAQDILDGMDPEVLYAPDTADYFSPLYRQRDLSYWRTKDLDCGGSDPPRNTIVEQPRSEDPQWPCTVMSLGLEQCSKPSLDSTSSQARGGRRLDYRYTQNDPAWASIAVPSKHFIAYAADVARRSHGGSTQNADIPVDPSERSRTACSGASQRHSATGRASTSIQHSTFTQSKALDLQSHASHAPTFRPVQYEGAYQNQSRSDQQAGNLTRTAGGSLQHSSIHQEQGSFPSDIDVLRMSSNGTASLFRQSSCGINDASHNNIRGRRNVISGEEMAALSGYGSGDMRRHLNTAQSVHASLLEASRSFQANTALWGSARAAQRRGYHALHGVRNQTSSATGQPFDVSLTASGQVNSERSRWEWREITQYFHAESASSLSRISGRKRKADDQLAPSQG
jgi:hypothetical protein